MSPVPAGDPLAVDGYDALLYRDDEADPRDEGRMVLGSWR